MDIAHYPVVCAQQSGLLAGSIPLNFLANPAGSAWTPHFPLAHSAGTAIEQLAQWRYGASAPPPFPVRAGYDAAGYRSLRGLGLLFDPYVDAALSARAFIGRRLPSDPVVLVLTDFGNFSGIGLPATTCSDWALAETLEFVNGQAKDSTSRNLYQCLGGGAGSDEDAFGRAIVRRELLLWNLVPFIRDAPSAVGPTGLPAVAGWLDQCWEWTERFCDCVHARTVILAPEASMRTASGKARLARPGRTMTEIMHPAGWRSQERLRQNCEELRAAAPDRSEKEGVLDLEE